jgi:hypothetical protein
MAILRTPFEGIEIIAPEVYSSRLALAYKNW